MTKTAAVTLLTDFGTQDIYVGVMKGVLQSVAPGVTLVDLTHHVPPQDIRTGACLLAGASPYFPPGTVHLAVVDPGVGTSRHPIAARIGDQVYVCPDNGLLTYVLARQTLEEAVVLDRPEFHRHPVSRTFHGRDIFAPAAAHLARGTPLRDMGTPIDSLYTLPVSRPEIATTSIDAHVMVIDVFGNVILDITEDMISACDPWVASCPAGRTSGIVRTYADMAEGDAALLFGSTGHLEIAVRNGHAARRLGLVSGDTVSLVKDMSPGGQDMPGQPEAGES